MENQKQKLTYRMPIRCSNSFVFFTPRHTTSCTVRGIFFKTVPLLHTTRCAILYAISPSKWPVVFTVFLSFEPVCPFVFFTVFLTTRCDLNNAPIFLRNPPRGVRSARYQTKWCACIDDGCKWAPRYYLRIWRNLRWRRKGTRATKKITAWWHRTPKIRLRPANGEHKNAQSGRSDDFYLSYA